ncbi:hypothetical protein B0T16DRAFT_330288 [Cercophora newfieldiana]|uniref:Uncharacterized protein n=1 Tax=Cercophora newfieldiana TaxID=92897 RepID=A0AA40CR63_9PEZI|nr:hypothetical protein B0T16DRAFT_330288 [Cercophora newfieldiana]
MASIAAAACRASLRLARNQLNRDATARAFRTSAAALAAQNFTMPALSPTMTEGNIAKWQVKEGEKFSAGDVLLEIETDKATMDVEAQEDGILMKITQGDGTKAIKVGTRIAVIAEEGDDISALEIPADETPQPKSAAEPAKPEQPSTPVAESQPSAPTSDTPKAAPKSHGRGPKRVFPPLPSVLHLLKENGLNESAISDITPTGPNGRILKGDVLAFLGKINAKTPSEVSTRFENASHLDLSNIKVAKAPEPKKAEKVAAPVPEKPKISTVEVSVSVSAVSAVQKTLEKKLGFELPFASFVYRAADLANERLPRAKATPDRLFNELLGVEKESDYFSRGAYLPDVGTLRSISSPPAAPKARPAKRSDIIDLLSAPSKRAAKPSAPAEIISGPATTFSLTVPSAEAERASLFLHRMKVILEEEPDKLVL